MFFKLRFVANFSFQRYPIIWQGKVALKTDSAVVQIHFVAGNIEYAQAGLPKPGENTDDSGMVELRIVRRMRMETDQMRLLRERMAVRSLLKPCFTRIIQ